RVAAGEGLLERFVEQGFLAIAEGLLLGGHVVVLLAFLEGLDLAGMRHVDMAVLVDRRGLDGHVGVGAAGPVRERALFLVVGLLAGHRWLLWARVMKETPKVRLRLPHLRVSSSWPSFCSVPRTLPAIIARKPGNSTSTVTAASATATCPWIAWPNELKAKFSRSPSQVFSRAPADPPRCRDRSANPSSMRRRASARPS